MILSKEIEEVTNDLGLINGWSEKDKSLFIQGIQYAYEHPIFSKEDPIKSKVLEVHFIELLESSSISAPLFAQHLSEAFSIKISSDEILGCDTLSNIVELVKSKL